MRSEQNASDDDLLRRLHGALHTVRSGYPYYGVPAAIRAAIEALRRRKITEEHSARVVKAAKSLGKITRAQIRTAAEAEVLGYEGRMRSLVRNIRLVAAEVSRRAK